MTMTEQKVTEAMTEVDATELARVLKNALVFAGTNPARPALMAVRITLADYKLTVESTDSFTLYRENLAIDNGGSGQFHMSSNDVKWLIDVAKTKKNTTVILTFSAETAAISNTSQTLEVDFWLGQEGSVTVDDFGHLYPDIDGVRVNLVSGEPIAEIGFSAKILARFAKLTPADWKPRKSKVGREDNNGAPVKFSFAGDGIKPTTVTIGENIDILVMPVRVS